MISRRNVFQFAAVVLPLGILLALLAQWLPAPGDLYAFFSRHRDAHPALRQAMRAVTDFGNPLLYVVYAVVLGVGLKTGNRKLVRFVAVYVIVQLLVSFLLVRGIKISLGAPRPDVSGFHEFFTLASSHHSFPSGHTTEIVGAALPLALWKGRLPLSLGLGLLVALMGFSRIYLGSHHILDVTFGLVLGAYAGLAIYAFREREARIEVP